MQQKKDEKILREFVIRRGITTRQEMQEKMGCSASRLRILIAAGGVKSSINHNSRYYAVIEESQYDENGLWEKDTVRFSREGTLTKTIVAAVERSEAGMARRQVKEIFGDAALPSLTKLLKEDLLRAEKYGGSNIYFATDSTQQALQKERRDRLMQEETAIDPKVIIAVLRAVIEHPATSKADLLLHLRESAPAISPAVLDRIWQEYDLEKKASGSGLIDLLKIRYDLAEEYVQLPENCRLQQGYPLRLTANECECGGRLLLERTETRYPVALVIGSPKVTYCQYLCSECGNRHCTNDLLTEFIEPDHQYGYDVMVFVGLEVVVRCQSFEATQRRLQEKHLITMPLSTMRTQVRRFLNFFAAVHERGAGRIRDELLQERWFLSLDGTSELGTDVIFSAIATYQVEDPENENKESEASTLSRHLTLSTCRMRSETTDGVIRFLRMLVALFGEAPAVLSDLSPKIAGAVKQVFSKSLHFICHFHFLENVGEKVLEDRHKHLQSALQKSGILAYLEGRRRDLQRTAECVEHIDADWIKNAKASLKSGDSRQNVRIRRILAYVGIKWVSDYRDELKGEHFPFELPALALYDRLRALRDKLAATLEGMPENTNKLQLQRTILNKLDKVVSKPELMDCVDELRTAQKMFNEFRSALRLNTENGLKLRRNRKVEFTLKDLQESRQQLETLQVEYATLLQSRKAAIPAVKVETAEILLTYLQKYKAELIQNNQVMTSDSRWVQVPRTNWLSEHSFSLKKAQWRKRSGTKQLRRCLQACSPEEFLVPNLQNDDYVGLLYQGDTSVRNMARIFAGCREAAKERREQKERNEEPTIKIASKFMRTSDCLISLGELIKMLAS